MDRRVYESPAEWTGGGEIETRREALKRFGRYAAIAPTTMLLLDPRQGHAYGPGGGTGGSKGGGTGGSKGGGK